MLKTEKSAVECILCQVDIILHVAAKFSFELLLRKFKPFIKKTPPVFPGNPTEMHCNNWTVLTIKISSALPKETTD